MALVTSRLRTRPATHSPNEPDGQRDEQHKPPQIAQLPGRHLDECHGSREEEQQPHDDGEEKENLAAGSRSGSHGRESGGGGRPVGLTQWQEQAGAAQLGIGRNHQGRFAVPPFHDLEP